MFHTENKYIHIPMLVFRITENRDELSASIECVKAFEGNSKWEVFKNPFSRKDNYILSVCELKEMYQTDREVLPFQRDYFGDNYEKFVTMQLVT